MTPWAELPLDFINRCLLLPNFAERVGLIFGNHLIDIFGLTQSNSSRYYGNVRYEVLQFYEKDKKSGLNKNTNTSIAIKIQSHIYHCSL